MRVSTSLGFFAVTFVLLGTCRCGVIESTTQREEITATADVNTVQNGYEDDRIIKDDDKVVTYKGNNDEANNIAINTGVVVFVVLLIVVCCLLRKYCCSGNKFNTGFIIQSFATARQNFFQRTVPQRNLPVHHTHPVHQTLSVHQPPPMHQPPPIHQPSMQQPTMHLPPPIHNPPPVNHPPQMRQTNSRYQTTNDMPFYVNTQHDEYSSPLLPQDHHLQSEMFRQLPEAPPPYSPPPMHYAYDDHIPHKY